ncbi:kinesin-like protein KIF26A [Tachyglossus aculeatus]|uniref:kinesin-like protein KIF26A n=1 Tax=Tachyglossus aculeatus TaxID=9261 RepID=UPI0018F291D0|nr:kinesin-like protein KIF26A [Tachyglossus aculeatus]
MAGRGGPLAVARPPVAEGGPGRTGPGEERCGSRPAPEGAGPGAGQGSEPAHCEQAGRGGWCHHCHTKLTELKRQAWKLVSGPGTPLLDPRLSALILDKVHMAGALQETRPEGETRCDVCAAHLNQLKQEAIRTIQGPSPGGPGSRTARAPALPSGQAGRLLTGPERHKGGTWAAGPGAFPGPSVQVTVGTGGLGDALSSVTIQAQQYLEGMWSLSRSNGFLPAACLADASAERDRNGPQGQAPSGPRPCDHNGSCAALNSQALMVPSSPGASAAASFFIRAAQKLNLSSKRKKYPPPLAPTQESSAYGTNFSGVLQLCPPPAPPCLLRAVSKMKDTPGIGKVKVMVRICPSEGAANSSESMSFLKVDPRRKQITLSEPAANGPSGAGPRRTAATTAVPKMFAFDAVFPQDASQAEVCSGTVAEVIQSVVNGADGCIFCFGQVKLGKSYTMFGRDASTQTLGIVPCAISWLFKLTHERKEKTGARFSIRVSAVEISGKDETLKDLLADVASGSLQDGQCPGVYLREDPVCGTQLQNQSELRAPTAEKAALFLDAALAARSTSRPDCDEEDRRNSHMLFTLHVYQYRMEKNSKGGMSGGRSRLHLIDLGSCEKVLSKSRDPGGSLCLSLSALGNVILALIVGAKHVPYKDNKLTMLLRESLGNINCRTTMIAHLSDSPALYAETLTTAQLASRIHRLRKKKSKSASSSSGGESSCEEGRVRRPPHLRPFHTRAVTLDPGLPALTLSGDPDYSSSSEQSCDTVIYVGPGGAALSDRELTDNEGPPDFVPIIPSLNRKRSRDPLPPPRSDRDHFKCNTFAELQERLECIDGSEEPAAFAGPGETSVPSPLAAGRRAGTASPKKGPGSHPATPRTCGGPESAPSKGEWKKVDAGPEGAGENGVTGGLIVLELGVKDRVSCGRGPLPGPGPPPPPQREAGLPEDTSPEADGSGGGPVRTPPVGMSQQPLGQQEGGPGGEPPVAGAVDICSPRGTSLDRDILTTTVTLQQPVELNGEDELVFTLVEELSIRGLASSRRPTSLISFSSDCSLQALASGSRPVSIISSINDEFDAYTAQAALATAGTSLGIEVSVGVGSSRRSSISSWLSDVSLGPGGMGEAWVSSGCPPLEGPLTQGPPGSPLTLECSPTDDHGLCTLELGAEGPRTLSSPVRTPGRIVCGPPHSGSLHRSLPRRAPPSPDGPFGDPWLARADDSGDGTGAGLRARGEGGGGTRRMACFPLVSAGPQRVVDGCEMSGRAAVGDLGSAGLGASLQHGQRARPLQDRGTCPVWGSGTEVDATSAAGSPRGSGAKKNGRQKASILPRPGGTGPPAPPVRKSSLEPKAGGADLPRSMPPSPWVEEEVDVRPRAGASDLKGPRATSSLKGRTGRSESALPPRGGGSTPALERCDSLLSLGGRANGGGRAGRSVPRLGVPPTPPAPPPPPPPAPGRPAQARPGPKLPSAGGKSRSLPTGGARTLGPAAKPPVPSGGKSPGAPPGGKGCGGKPGRGTVMGTRQALRAAHSRVNELASGTGGRSELTLPSPYSKITAPRRPQRHSSGHGSDNSSVLSGELPPAMGRTALFYHSGGSSGYESMIRDSETTGSASSAHDSMSESSLSSTGRVRSLKSPKKRSTGLQRRRLIPAPLPDAATLGRKPSLTGQWVDLPPLPGTLKEPFEIKVYEIDDVERLQRHRQDEPEVRPFQDVEKGLLYFNTKLKLLERRQQKIREVKAKHDILKEELEETKGRLMINPNKWKKEFEVDPDLDKESQEYLEALELVTEELEQCVNLCKSHVMIVTCFDIGMVDAQEVEV